MGTFVASLALALPTDVASVEGEALLEGTTQETVNQTYQLGLQSSRTSILQANRNLYDSFVANGGQLISQRSVINYTVNYNRVLGAYNSVNNTITLYNGSNLSTLSEELIHWSQIQRAGLIGQQIPASMVPGLESEAATVLQQWGYVPLQ
jgi:hypothetical protein